MGGKYVCSLQQKDQISSTENTSAGRMGRLGIAQQSGNVGQSHTIQKRVRGLNSAHEIRTKPIREVNIICGEEAPQRGSTNPSGDKIGSRAAPSEDNESLTLQSRRVIAIEVAVVIVISEGICLALPGDLLFPGFRGSQ